MRQEQHIFEKKKKSIKSFKTDFLTEERAAKVYYLALSTVTYAHRLTHYKTISF